MKREDLFFQPENVTPESLSKCTSIYSIAKLFLRHIEASTSICVRTYIQSKSLWISIFEKKEGSSMDGSFLDRRIQTDRRRREIRSKMGTDVGYVYVRTMSTPPNEWRI